VTLPYPPLKGAGGHGSPADGESPGCTSDSAGGVAPGPPGSGATARGPAAPGSDGVPRGTTARHTVPALLALCLTACGTPAPTAAPRTSPAPVTTPAVTTPPTPSSPAAPAPGTTAPARAHAAGSAPAASRGADPTASGPPLPSGLPSSAPLRVTLASPCVTPGGEQSVAVATVAGAFVAFDNLYPDNRTGAVHGGADGRGRADGNGRYAATWRIAPGTPAGRVRVDVGVSAKSGSAITMAYYRLADRC
jgi:hypothetical protein